MGTHLVEAAGDAVSDALLTERKHPVVVAGPRVDARLAANRHLLNGFIPLFFSKSSRTAAVGFVFVAEVAAEAALFADDLHHHDGEEDQPYEQRLPGP